MLSLTSIAQMPGFIPMDDSLKAMLHFYDADTILVVMPDNYNIPSNDIHALENFVFWKDKPIYTYKHESEFQATDTLKKVQFFGPANKFSSQVIIDLPFQIIEDGFVFKGRRFNQPQDAFYYMHPSGKRIYTCHNGEEYSLTYIGFLAGAYQLYVFHGNEIVYSGDHSLTSAESQLNDMDKLREVYFCRIISCRYFKLNFACTFTQDSLSDSLGIELDDYVKQLCHYLNVDTLNIRHINTYCYNLPGELNYFIAAPLWQTIYGKSFGDINHITGFDLPTFKHETGHSIIADKIGDNPSAFFMEGFRQFTDYFFSETAYNNDLNVFRDKHELLTPALVTAPNVEFFKNMAHYSISGLFVAYMIKLVGLEAFKAAYAENNIEGMIKQKGLSVEQLIHDFKNGILK